MNAIAEPPVERPDFLTRITPEKARSMSAKAVEARRKRRDERKKREEERIKAEINGKIAGNSPVVNPRVLRLEVEMTRIEQRMSKTVLASDLRDLTNAHSRLFAVWQVLTATPGPGVRKQGKDRLKPILEADPFALQAPQQAAYTPVFDAQNIPL